MGDLDVVITHHGQKVHMEREALGDGRFRYTFVPGETGHYEVKATFNNDSIPGEEYLAVVLIVCSISCAQICHISCAQMTIPGEKYLALVLIVCCISCAQMISI